MIVIAYRGGGFPARHSQLSNCSALRAPHRSCMTTGIVEEGCVSPPREVSEALEIAAIGALNAASALAWVTNLTQQQRTAASAQGPSHGLQDSSDGGDRAAKRGRQAGQSAVAPAAEDDSCGPPACPVHLRIRQERIRAMLTELTPSAIAASSTSRPSDRRRRSRASKDAQCASDLNSTVASHTTPRQTVDDIAADPEHRADISFSATGTQLQPMQSALGPLPSKSAYAMEAEGRSEQVPADNALGNSSAEEPSGIAEVMSPACLVSSLVTISVSAFDALSSNVPLVSWIVL